MPEASFRLAPNYLKTGEVATLHAERVPAALFEQACTIDLLEVDADGAAKMILRCRDRLCGRRGARGQAQNAHGEQASNASHGPPLFRVLERAR